MKHKKQWAMMHVDFILSKIKREDKNEKAAQLFCSKKHTRKVRATAVRASSSYSTQKSTS